MEATIAIRMDVADEAEVQQVINDLTGVLPEGADVNVSTSTPLVVGSVDAQGEIQPTVPPG